MNVTIKTDAIKLTITDGLITGFSIDGEEDVNQFRQKLTSLSRVLDDVIVEILTVCHLNAAIDNDDEVTMTKHVDQIESGMYLYCHCSDCLLGYLRASIKVDGIRDDKLRTRCKNALSASKEENSN